MLCICTFTVLKQSHLSITCKQQKFIIIIYSFLSPFLPPFLPPSLPPSFLPPSLPVSFLTISPPSATSSANSGIILLVTSSCCICGGRGVVCMTETTCKCTGVVTKNNYHSDDQCPSPLPSLTHTHCTCYAPFPKCASLSPPTPTHPPTHTHQLFPSNLKQTLVITRQ